MSAITNCPLCSRDLQKAAIPVQNRDAMRIDCGACGSYDFNENLSGDSRFDALKPLIRAWIRRETKNGVYYPFVHANMVDALEHMGFPRTANEKMDALLRAYAEIGNYGDVIHISNHAYLVTEVAARGDAELLGLNKLLRDLNFVKSVPADDLYQLRLTAQGWLHLEELTKVRYSSDSAFIAMWYDKRTEDYRNSVSAALQTCGYKPLMVDRHDFNDFIMDQVVAMIREARFLIADLTCAREIEGEDKEPKQGVRGGVYWEAGMAYGMGKAVIQTCEDTDECRRRIHFDLEQYRTTFWKRDDLASGAFVKNLSDQILATLGKGSYRERQA